MKLIATFLFITLISFSKIGNAQIIWGTDPTFNGNGKFTHDYGFFDNITNVKIQPNDQKIIAIGTALNQAFSGRLLVMRLMPDGTFDNTFNDSGSVVISDFTESYAYDCFIRDDGKILIVGAAANPSYEFNMVLLRLNADGSRDDSFGTNGVVVTEFNQRDEYAYGVSKLSDNTFIVAGSIADSLNQAVPTIVKFKEDGSVDQFFGNNGIVQIPVISSDNVLRDILIQPDNKILASGHYDQGITVGGNINFDLLLIRLNPNGSFDNGFGTNGVVITSVSNERLDDANGLGLTSNNDILVGGFSVRPDGGFDATILKYNADGTSQTTFGTNGRVILDIAAQDVAYDLEILADQSILIAGSSGDLFGTGEVDYLLVKYKPEGVRDSTFGTNGIILTAVLNSVDDANAMTIQNDGKIVLAGKSTGTINNDVSLVRYSPTDFTGIQNNQDENSFRIFPNPALSNTTLNISFKNAFNGSISLRIYALDGKLVTQNNLFIQNNFTQTTLPVNLQSGIYFVEISNQNGFKNTNRLVINN